ncbi:hypothetical protein [Kribbella italica]|uniref:Uncharacterized protein n=1 Tax=Kribbella italica TaxID=1540520 RepID=A0A7W9MT21_9ACTN|nr:hypothetical protein [Kribbella italica]MBB5834675.1 hypothetical protein [Kribbella italica]
MKTLLRLGGVLLLIVMSAWVAAPAQAGGPTSVLVSAPAIPKVVAAGYQEARYNDLMSSVGMQAKNHPGWEADKNYGRVIRATWLIHDMSVWRLDLIYPDAEGGPWVATFESYNETMADKPVWHPAGDGVALTKVLGELGLLPGKAGSDGATPDVAVSEDVTTAAAATTSDGTDAFTGWRWALPGALVGAVLAVVAVKFWPRRRWELIDQE